MLSVQYFLALPPLFPKRPRQKIFLEDAYFKTFNIFFELPDVDITINASLFLYKA